MLKGERSAPEFLKVNPKGVVPVLVWLGQLLVDWVPVDLREEMAENGRRSWPAVQRLLKAA